MIAPTSHPPERVVLVVDDEEVVRQITTRILTEAGFRVLEAQNSAEALRLLAKLGPQVVWLVVTDILMPGMSGEELAKTIARRWPAVQVLLLSAQSEPLDGFTGSFLQKPFTPDTLVALVSALPASQKAPIG